jgi:hypothetical protein
MNHVTPLLTSLPVAAASLAVFGLTGPEGSIRLLLFRARRRLADIIGGTTQNSDPEAHE